MSSFRPGDRHVLIGGQSTRLRLTISALAEIAEQLGAETPRALADRLRTALLTDWNKVLTALAEPRPKTDLSEAEMALVLPDLTAVIVAGLSS